MKTDVTIILDRSGSMHAVHEATVAGINDFVRSVKEVPGETTVWTLALFDDRDSAWGAREEFPHFVWRELPDERVPRLEPSDYFPRGNTALVDAVCVVLEAKKERWLRLPAAERPAVMIVIVTDGLENSSRARTSADMRKLIAELQERHAWGFQYLGANQDAFVEARKYGIDEKTAGGILRSYAGLCSSSSAYAKYAAANLTPVVHWCATNEGVAAALNSASAAAQAFKAASNVHVSKATDGGTA